MTMTLYKWACTPALKGRKATTLALGQPGREEDISGVRLPSRTEAKTIADWGGSQRRVGDV